MAAGSGELVRVTMPALTPRPPREWYGIKAYGWFKGRRYPTVVRAWALTWSEMASRVLMLEMRGYRCEVRRIGRGRG